MTEPARPRRSVLYMPGSNPRALEKAKALAVDGLILDLEDAVAPDAKSAAREGVVRALADRQAYGRRELVVRTNGLDTRWGYEDLEAVARSGADAVLLPKVESADSISRALAVLDSHGAPADLPIWAMIETPRGVLRAEEIASAARIACLVIGTSDLTKELHARPSRERLAMLPSLGLCLLAARAAGVSILDGVHLELADQEGFALACRQGRVLGFDGKTLIHPSQIEIANATFGPDEAALTEARAIITAFEEATASGKGVVVVGGRLVENLHVAEARRLLALAQAIEAMRAP